MPSDAGNDVILSNALKFYSKSDNYHKLRKIINHKPGKNYENGKVSLRLIDWFITNYTKENKTSIKKKDGVFIIHEKYKQMIKSYHKKKIDPFNRNCEIITIKLDKISNNSLETSLCQMQFIKWIIEYEILDYIIEHQDAIHTDLTLKHKSRKSKSDDSSSGGISEELTSVE